MMREGMDAGSRRFQDDGNVSKEVNEAAISGRGRA